MSGVIVQTARALLTLDDTSLDRSLPEAEAKVDRAVGAIRTNLSKLESSQISVRLAQEKYTSAVTRFGAESPQAERALISLAAKQRELADSMRESVAETNRHSKVLSLFGANAGRASGEVDRLGKSSEGAGSKLKGMAGSLVFAGGAFIGASGLISVLRTGIGEAESFQKQTERLTALFPQQAKAIEAWAKTAADSMGLSQTAAVQAAADVGQLLRGFDVAPAKAAGMSTSIVKLASDLAAFRGVSFSTALSALEHGLAGQSRGLKLYGVDLDATRLKAQALSMGLLKASVDQQKVSEANQQVAIDEAKLAAYRKEYGDGTTQVASASKALEEAQSRLADTMSGKVGPALTGQQKALASYAIIMHDTALEHGFFAKHANDLGEAEARLHAHLQNAEKEIGVALMPTVIKFIDVIDKWLQRLQKTGKLQKDVNEIVHTAVGIVTDFVDVIKAVWGPLQDMVHALGGTKDAVMELLAVMAVSKIRTFVGAMLQGLLDVDTQAVKTKATMIAGAGETAAAEEGAATATMTAWDVAMANMGAAVKAFLASTVIGILVVGVGIAIVEIIDHWNTFKKWLADFGQWIWNHLWILYFLPIVGEMVWLTGEIIKHWQAVWDFLKRFASDFAELFTHPIAAVGHMFSLLESAIVGTLKAIATQIGDILSAIPGKILGIHIPGASEIHSFGTALKDWGSSGTKLGDNFAQNAESAVTAGLNTITGQIQAATSSWNIAGAFSNAVGGALNAKNMPKGSQQRILATARSLGVGSGGLYAKGGGHGGIAKPGSVLDCSGFVYQTYTQSGFQGFPGTSETQWTTMSGPNWVSEVVASTDAQPGDVVFMVGSPEYPSPGHVGIVTSGSGGSAEVMQYYSTGHPADTIPLSSIGDLVGIKRFYLLKRASAAGNNASPSGPTSTPPPLPTGTKTGALKVGKKASALPAVPVKLEDQLREAKLTQDPSKILAALHKIDAYLTARVSVEADSAEKEKQLAALDSVRAQEGESAYNPLIPPELQKRLDKAELDNSIKAQLGVLKQVDAYLTKRWQSMADGVQKTKVFNDLLRVRKSEETLAAKQLSELDKQVAANQKKQQDAAAAALAAEKAKVTQITAGGSQDLGSSPATLELAQQKVDIAAAKLKQAQLKYQPNSVDVAHAQEVLGKAQQQLAKAQQNVGGQEQVKFDPKSGKYIVTKVTPDLQAMKAELKHLLSKVLPKLDREIRAVRGAIARLSKFPKKDQNQLQHMAKTLQSLQRERAGMIQLAAGLQTSLDQIGSAVAAGAADAFGADTGTATSDLTGGAISTPYDSAEQVAQSGLSVLQNQQGLAGTASTPTGLQAQASYITNTLVPASQAVVASLQSQYTAATASGNTSLADQIAAAIASKQNDIFAQQLQALQAIEAAAQAQVDIATHAETMVNDQLQIMQTGQQLAGTSGTPAGLLQQASFITGTIVPAAYATLQALQQQYGQALDVGDTTLANSIAEAIAGKQNDILTDQLNALQAIEAASQAQVDLATHQETLASTGQNAQQLLQQLANLKQGFTGTTPAQYQQQAAYIQQSVIPAIQGVLAALQTQYQQAVGAGDTVLANQIAEAIAGKQNDLLQAQIDILTDIRTATQVTEASVTGYLTGITDLRGFASNVLAQAYSGQTGATPGLSVGAGTVLHVENYFGGPPPDPGTYASSLEFELQTLLS